MGVVVFGVDFFYLVDVVLLAFVFVGVGFSCVSCVYVYGVFYFLCRVGWVCLFLFICFCV